MSDFIPTEVQHYIDELTVVGLPYRLVYDLPRKIKLICENERVYADATFKRRKGHWYNAKPKLTIDGITCEYARSFEELAMIMVMPDLHLGVEKIRRQFPNGFTYRKNPAHPVIGVDPADPAIPERVKLKANSSQVMLRRKYPTVTMRFEHPSPDLWQIRMSGIEGTPGEFVVLMVPEHGSWKVDTIMLVVTPGPDNLGLDLGSEMESALSEFIAEQDRPTQTGPVSRARTVQGANQALEVKRHTVIRN